jgi:hypothetical protein
MKMKEQLFYDLTIPLAEGLLYPYKVDSHFT